MKSGDQDSEPCSSTSWLVLASYFIWISVFSSTQRLGYDFYMRGLWVQVRETTSGQLKEIENFFEGYKVGYRFQEQLRRKLQGPGQL